MAKSKTDYKFIIICVIIIAFVCGMLYTISSEKPINTQNLPAENYSNISSKDTVSSLNSSPDFELIGYSSDDESGGGGNNSNYDIL